MSIDVSNVSYTYSAGSPYEKMALDRVSIEIKENDFLGIIGHTGSGKSTFIQHLNGLLKLQSGGIVAFGIDLSQKKADLRKLRGIVGMVFQYPEYQLFDETVYADVSFGPKNIGMLEEEIDIAVRNAIELVGLDFDNIKNRSPFDLSGGQKRRVAIAGVIAMQPKVLVLDEPTAGLDPLGKQEILDMVKKLRETSETTIIMISHDIDEIAEFCTRVIVFNKAKLIYDLKPQDLFYHADELYEMGLDIPAVVKIANNMRAQGISVPKDIYKFHQLIEYITGNIAGVVNE